MDPTIQPQKESLAKILNEGEITLQGQFVLGYNYTFLVQVVHEGNKVKAIYKPNQGEQPIWDFPDYNLSRREMAAFLVSDFLGWDLVPVTVLRDTGPFGPGSVQFYVEHDPSIHYFTFEDEIKSRLRSTALFDLLINNADRKGGHILLDATQKIWLIDHGLCFHEEEKLRTVIWDFSGESIPDELMSDIFRLKQTLNAVGLLGNSLSNLINKTESAALLSRCQNIIDKPIFPHPPSDRRYFPYPPV